MKSSRPSQFNDLIFVQVWPLSPVRYKSCGARGLFGSEAVNAQPTFAFMNVTSLAGNVPERHVCPPSAMAYKKLSVRRGLAVKRRHFTTITDDCGEKTPGAYVPHPMSSRV